MGNSALASRIKTALITGASSGLGLAFAKMLTEHGVEVYGTTRNPDRSGLDQKISWLELEASSIEKLREFANDHRKLLTRLDLLVNNAGSSYYSRESSSLSEICIDQQNLLLTAPMLLTQEVLEGMRARAAGTIVNVSSLAAVFPLPYMAGYSAGKAGLSAYTQGLMVAERGSGVSFIDFQAGDYKTSFNANIRKGAGTDEDMERAWQRLEQNMLNSPTAERAARDLKKALEKEYNGTIRSGGFFQSCVAPLGKRLLPDKLVRAGIRLYYRIK